MSGSNIKSILHIKILSTGSLSNSSIRSFLKCSNWFSNKTTNKTFSKTSSKTSSKTTFESLNLRSGCLTQLTMPISVLTTPVNMLTMSVSLALLTMSGQAMAQTSTQNSMQAPSKALKTSNESIDQDVKNNLAERLINEAKQKNLATHPTWLRLHYFDTKGQGTPASYKSKIDNSDFFVSKEGNNNPEAELEAFIRIAVQEGVLNTSNGTFNTTTSHTSASQTTNDSLACRFPARTHWLQSQLGLEQTPSNCPEFDAWMQKLDPQRLSVVFAEEYPNRAVSAFGHTLMLIDSSASLADPSAIDKAHALNDTVGGDASDPFIMYAIKSTFGNYPNDITIEPYPDKLSEYLQQDNRDVWTYALNLSDSEVQQIMRHVWETKDLELPYYFTLDNCASEILRYIDVVRPQGNLLDEFKVAIVPSDVVKLLNKEGLITEQNYFPADDTIAQAKMNNAHFQNPQLNHLPKSSITENNKLVVVPLTYADNNTLNAHSRQRFMVGAGAIDDTSYLSLAYRGGFNAPLDRPSGYPHNFHLEAGSLALRAYKDEKDESDKKGDHDKLELQQLTILRGRSFNPINTARNGDSLLSSWGVNIEAIQVKDGSQMNRSNSSKVNDGQPEPVEQSAKSYPQPSHLVGNIGYEKGVSLAFGIPSLNTGELPPHLCYAFGNGNAQLGKGLSKGYRVGVGVNLGCRYQLGSNARLVGEVQLPYWYHGSSSVSDVKSHYWQPKLSLGAQYDVDKNQAIRLEGSYQLQDDIEGGDDIQLSYVKYF